MNKFNYAPCNNVSFEEFCKIGASCAQLAQKAHLTDCIFDTSMGDLVAMRNGFYASIWDNNLCEWNNCN